MLGLFLNLISQTIIFQNYNIPEPKSIVEEVEALPPLPVAVQMIEKKEEPYNINCYCVSFARLFVKDLPRGNANSFLPNTQPAVGRIAIFNYNGLSHIAVISSLEATGFVVTEANYKPCEKTVRLVKYNDKYLIGFYEKTLLK